MSTKWDERFMELAKTVSKWSKDPDHKVGAVIVDKCNRVLSLGYNGPPKGLKDLGLARDIEVLRTIHAELNAILNSFCGSLEGCTLYVYPFSPCAQCAAAIIQKGITRVVYHKQVDLGTWKESQQAAIALLAEAKVLLES